MREKLNKNPLLQVGLIAVMGIAVAFLLFTRVMNRGAEAEPAATTPAATAPAPADGSAPAATTPPTVDPAVAASGNPDIAAGKFVAGPGLPGDVVEAYEDNKSIVLLITRHKGIDDRRVIAQVDDLRSRSDLAVFKTPAKGIARFSRITSGVEVDRTPALVLIAPRRISDGPPAATVSYGFRNRESVEQAVSDALYDGRSDIPYHPE